MASEPVCNEVIRLRSTQVFLCGHPALQAFCHSWRDRLEQKPSPDEGSGATVPIGAIVCERKEDIVSIRSQVFHELRDLGGTTQSLGGLSTYTLDGLGRSLANWLHFALRRMAFQPGTEPVFGRLTRSDLGRDYLDAVTQEKLVRHVLLAVGYTGSDAAPLAKQILALIDHPLPDGVSLVDCLGPLERGAFVADVDRAHLSGATMLLCALQVALQTLRPTNFLRLQSLLIEGFAQASEHILDDLTKTLPPVMPFLTGPLLWVEAPQYGYEHTTDGDLYKPGNFDPRTVSDLLDAVLSLRSKLAHNESEGSQSPRIRAPSWIAETHIRAVSLNAKSPKSKPDDHGQTIEENELKNLTAVRELIVHGGLVTFYRNTQRELTPEGLAAHKRAMAPRASILALRGDLKLEHLRTLDPDGAGVYAVGPVEVESYLSVRQPKTSAQSPSPNFPRAAPTPLLKTLPESTLQALEQLWSETSLIEDMLARSHEILRSIADQYGLTHLATTPLERFRILARDLRSQTRPNGSGPVHPLEGLPQALSLLPGAGLPSEIHVYGKPHSPKQPSYNVRILNQIFHELRNRGAAVSLPASDLMYRVFWRALFFGSTPVRIHLVDDGEREELEHLLGAKTISAVPLTSMPHPYHDFKDDLLQNNFALVAKVQAAKAKGESFCVPDWYAIRQQIRGKAAPRREIDSRPTVSMTAFETYAQCPMKFLLQHVYFCKDIETDPLDYDRSRTGTHIHRTLEMLTSALNLYLSSSSNQESENAESENASSRLSGFLAAWYEQILQPEVFVSTSSATYLDAAKKAASLCQGGSAAAIGSRACIDVLLVSLIEVVESLFGSTPRNLQESLEVEARKRLFVSFLHAESCRNAEDNLNGMNRQIAFVEKPLALTLGGKNLEHPAKKFGASSSFGLRLEGKADRIDILTPRPNVTSRSAVPQPSMPSRAIEIIDYKTSKPKPNAKQLQIFPQSKTTAAPDANSHISVQGGLYLTALFVAESSKSSDEAGVEISLGDSNEAISHEPDHEPDHEPNLDLALTFSLMRLGSLSPEDSHPIISATIDLSTPEGRAVLGSGIQELEARAAALLQGQFDPAPDSPGRCRFCEFRTQCPGPWQGDSALGEEEET